MQVDPMGLLGHATLSDFVLDHDDKIAAVGDDAIENLLTFRRLNRRAHRRGIRRKPDTDAAYRLPPRKSLESVLRTCRPWVANCAFGKLCSGSFWSSSPSHA